MQSATHNLADLIDLDGLQRMCDSLAAASDIGLGVLDPGGAVLVAAGRQDICTRCHRVHEDSLKGCLEAPRYRSYKCANGLWDVAFPLIIAGEHLGRVFTGQFFYDDDEILLEARILAVADVVEAMTSHRPYRPALGVAAALEEVRSGAGTRYDADAVVACQRVFERGFVFTKV